MTRRFVVLLHEVGSAFSRTDRSHWDWMFQAGDCLRTWATEPLAVPTDGRPSTIQARCEPLSPHRIAYLDYEGPVSGNRGQVRRVMHGDFETTDETDDCFIASVRYQLSNQVDAPEQRGQVRFQRIALPARLISDDNCGDWSMRWECGLKETN